MMRGHWLGLVLVGVIGVGGGSAVAAPLKIRNGSSVRVALHGKREAGVGLRAGRGGWRLELAAAPSDVADVVDVTDGANGAKWTVVGVIKDFRHYRLPQPMGPAMYYPYASYPGRQQTISSAPLDCWSVARYSRSFAPKAMRMAGG